MWARAYQEGDVARESQMRHFHQLHDEALRQAAVEAFHALDLQRVR